MFKRLLNILGYKAVITQQPSEIQKADKVVLPGVGAFRDAMQTIKQKGIDKVLYDVVEQKSHF